MRREIEHLAPAAAGSSSSHELAVALRNVGAASREARSPAESLIEMLHPWVAFGIMPVFALANARVSPGGLSLAPPSLEVASGVAASLLLGKPAGVLLVSCLVLRSGLASLPSGLTMRHLVVLGVVAGIGFTMALFIAQLAFTDATLLAVAKLGVLGASAAAASAGLVLGRLLLKPFERPDIARTADEAESSTEV